MNLKRYLSTSVKFGFSKTDLLYDPLRIFFWIGLYPLSLDLVYQKVLLMCYISGAWLIFALALKGVFVYKDTSFMVECLQNCILMLHGSGKVINLYLQRDNIVSLLKMYSKFWNIHNIDNKHVKAPNLRLCMLAKKIMRPFYISAVVGAALFSIKPPACYIPPGWEGPVAILHGLILLVLTFSVVTIDGIFCLLGVAITIQFNILGTRYKEVMNQKEFMILVDHHNLLLKCCDLLKHAFSGAFLLQYLAANVSAATSIFIVTQRDSWKQALILVTYFFLLCFETIFYCIPAEFITTAMSQMNDNVYSSRWYATKTISFKKNVLIILNKSCKPFAFEAYGFLFINLRTLVTISRRAFSFYTFLSSIEKIK